MRLTYIVLTILLAQCINAVNLGFFSSLSRNRNRSTQQSTRRPTTTPVVIQKTGSIKLNQTLDSITIATVKATMNAIIEKHELENEFTEGTTERNKCENITNTNKTSNLEIDETSECPQTTTNSTMSTTTIGSGLEIDETKKHIKNFPLGSIITPVPQIIYPKLPPVTLPKQKTIVITNIVIEPVSLNLMLSLFILTVQSFTPTLL